MLNKVSGGVIHEVPQDLAKELNSKRSVFDLWESLTPLARNEWICWVTSVKKQATRKQHVDRVSVDLLNGKRRPCCWIGCTHRNDKEISPSVSFILKRKRV